MRVILYEFEFEYQDKLEKEIATHSSIYVWEIPWTEEPGGLQFMGSQESDKTLATKPLPPPFMGQIKLENKN